MPFFSKKTQKPAPQKSDTNHDGLNEDELSPAERAYLEDMERRATGEARQKGRTPAEEEARHKELELLRQNFQAQMPLYERKQGLAGGIAGKADSEPPVERNPAAERAAIQQARRETLQKDPRYKEYYERLRRESERAIADPSATSTSGTFRRVDLTPRPDKTSTSPPGRATSANDDLCSGCILHLDDDSVAVYKDAVSGKDYALLYFLEPDGRIDPRGIFLEQYEIQKLGQIPDPLFKQMIERKRWERDPIIFHLDSYNYSKYIPTPPPPRRSTSSEKGGESTRRRSATESQSESGASGSGTNWRRTRPPTRPDTQTGEQKGAGGSSKRDPMLERGRVLRINVGGRVWDAVYWTEDEMGAIVAHDTNKTWALMHLNLGRFRDSIEYGDVLSYEKLSEIEHSIAQSQTEE